MRFVAPPSIRLWILKHPRGARFFRNVAVAPPSIRLWILKLVNDKDAYTWPTRCTPFDPLVDTETHGSNVDSVQRRGCTPFDPLVDTETWQIVPCS